MTDVFVARWNGTTWSTVADVPNPPGNDPSGLTLSYLTDISCVSAAMCFAVGSHYTSSTGNTPLIERWDGAAWTIVSGPETSNVALEAVSCLSASSCFAVGFGGVIERFDGTSWSVAPSPLTNLDNLFSISCNASTNCFASGYATDLAGFEDPTATLVVRWDGTTWSIVPSPTPAKAQTAELFGVTCPSASKCMAVGHYSLAAPDDDVRPTSTLVEQWNGASWSIVPSVTPHVAAFPASPVESDLFGVSSAPGTGCVAVGGYSTPQAGFTLAERAP